MGQVAGPGSARQDTRVLEVLEVPRTLVVTNDFPPRVGGVQQYLWNLVSRFPPDRVAVLAPGWPGWRAHDEAQPFRVDRWPVSFLWPTADLSRRARSLAREHRADVILFGHGYPTPLIGPSLAGDGHPYVVLTHGAEVWMARTPGLASSMRWAFGRARAVTVLSEYTRSALRHSIPREVRVVKLTPGVDEGRFRPDVDGAWVRELHGLGGRPVVLCVSRLVPRKGQDVLIRGLEALRTLVPDSSLLIVGAGPHQAKLRGLARSVPAGSVVFAGEVSDGDLPGYYGACDAFAMPCRSRWGGLEVEGFGIVYLEAAATARPVVAGRSGGAGEAVADTVSGLVTEGREPKAVALSLWRVLAEDGPGRAMGLAGRARVEAEFTWDRQVGRLAEILRTAAG